MPEFGSTTSIQSSNVFAASASDPDPGTTLHIRWAVDYPPYTSNTYLFPPQDLPAPADNKPLTINQMISCTNINDRSTSTHYVELIVADAPLADPDPSQPNPLEQLTARGSIAYGRWTINITCPQFMTTP